MRQDWLLPTIGTICCWSAWAFLPKLSAQTMATQSAIIYQGIGGTILTVCFFLTLGSPLETQPQGVILSLVAGVLNLLGVLFYIYALSRGSVAIVSTLSALYPLVVIVLGVVVLGETLTLRQTVGIGLGLAAIALIAA